MQRKVPSIVTMAANMLPKRSFYPRPSALNCSIVLLATRSIIIARAALLIILMSKMTIVANENWKTSRPCEEVEPGADRRIPPKKSKQIPPILSRHENRNCRQLEMEAVHIKTLFHIIISEGNPSEGHVSDQKIDDNLQVIKDAYAFAQFQFNKGFLVTTPANLAWYTTNCAEDYEFEMKTALCNGRATDLNVYILEPARVRDARVGNPSRLVCKQTRLCWCYDSQRVHLWRIRTPL
jgi:hypothetical protein